MDTEGKFEYWIIVNKTEDQVLNYSGMWSEFLINIKKYRCLELAEIDAERVDGIVKTFTGTYSITNNQEG